MSRLGACTCPTPGPDGCSTSRSARLDTGAARIHPQRGRRAAHQQRRDNASGDSRPGKEALSIADQGGGHGATADSHRSALRSRYTGNPPTGFTAEFLGDCISLPCTVAFGSCRLCAPRPAYPFRESAARRGRHGRAAGPNSLLPNRGFGIAKPARRPSATVIATEFLGHDVLPDHRPRTATAAPAHRAPAQASTRRPIDAKVRIEVGWQPGSCSHEPHPGASAPQHGGSRGGADEKTHSALVPPTRPKSVARPAAQEVGGPRRLVLLENPQTTWPLWCATWRRCVARGHVRDACSSRGAITPAIMQTYEPDGRH